MADSHRSGCPINLTLEALGDKWSLIVVRDIMFGGRRRFRELLAGSEEGIASNILADRLQHLVELGVLTRAADPTLHGGAARRAPARPGREHRAPGAARRLREGARQEAPSLVLAGRGAVRRC